MDNVAALYFTDSFHLSLESAGVVAGSFGLMNLFARALGGIVSDASARRWGLTGRAWLLACTIFAEGVGLLLFSRASTLPLAIVAMMITGVFVKMSNGANYALVPFVNKRAVGSVAGIVGAGGNVGAVISGLLFKSPALTYPQAVMVLGAVILILSPIACVVPMNDRRKSTATAAGEIDGETWIPVAEGAGGD